MSKTQDEIDDEEQISCENRIEAQEVAISEGKFTIQDEEECPVCLGKGGYHIWGDWTQCRSCQGYPFSLTYVKKL